MRKRSAQEYLMHRGTSSQAYLMRRGTHLIREDTSQGAARDDGFAYRTNKLRNCQAHEASLRE